MKKLLVYGGQWNPETSVVRALLDEQGLEYNYEEYTGMVNTVLPIVLVVEGKSLIFESTGLLTGKKIEEIKEALVE